MIKRIAFSRALSPLRSMRRFLLAEAGAFSQSIRECWWNHVVPHPAVPSTWRSRFYRRKKGLDIFPTTHIMSGCSFDKNHVRIGRETFVNKGVSFVGTADISIGEHCAIGHGVMFVTITHEMEWEDRRAGVGIEQTISIGDGVWIAARAIILPGTEVGDGCVIAAGAVVRGQCEAHGFYAGVPARRIKELPRGKFHHQAGAQNNLFTK